MPVEITASAAARRVLERRGQSGGLPPAVQNNLGNILAEPQGRINSMGGGFYRAELNGGYRAIFATAEGGKPVLIYVGDHTGYDDLSTRIRHNPELVKKEFLLGGVESIHVPSGKAPGNIALDDFNKRFGQAAGYSHIQAANAPQAQSGVSRALERDINTVLESSTEKMAAHDPATGNRYIYDPDREWMVTVDNTGKKTISYSGTEEFGALEKRLGAQTLEGRKAMQFAAEAASDTVTHIPPGKMRAPAGAVDDVARVSGIARVFGRAAGRVAPMVGVALLGTEVLNLGSKAEAATLNGRLSPQAYEQYKNILAGQVASGLDPTIIGGELAVQSAYDTWAVRNIGDERLREELRPSGLLHSLGIRRSPEEMKLLAFYESIPNQETLNMPPELRDLVAIRQQIKTQSLELAQNRMNQPLFTDPMAWIERQRHQNRLEELQESFGREYQRRLQDGSVDRWLAQNYAARAREIQPSLQIPASALTIKP